jgi:hypothetical protein
LHYTVAAHQPRGTYDSYIAALANVAALADAELPALPARKRREVVAHGEKKDIYLEPVESAPARS